jgi:hypothetical protein
MDLCIETLDDVEAPMSDEFWTGFVGGVVVIGTIAAVVAT